MDQNRNTIRIGCASAFWGDTETAAQQLVQQGDIDYLVFDYLAEVTLSIMVSQRMKDPNAGFATDFVHHVMTPLLSEIKNRGIKVISNAGGINPKACCEALSTAAKKANVNLKIALVSGDDLSPQRSSIMQSPPLEMFTDKPLPPFTVAMNAYLGAPAIATALDQGADIIITGRVTDSALVLGPLIHGFAWPLDDYAKLSQGSLAGHIIECGAQCTGGNFTDWQDVPQYDNMGFPIVECYSDGYFEVSKPSNTGGLVTTATVAEQIVYEIGDPACYFLPDVTCDWRSVELTQVDNDRVGVSGAIGYPPTSQYKVSAIYPEGFKITAAFVMAGLDVVVKAQAICDAIFTKTSRLFEERHLGPYQDTHIELIGSGALYGKRDHDCREIMVKLAASHQNKKALVLLSREIAQAATGMAPGIANVIGGRPTVYPIAKLFSFLYDKDKVNVSITLVDHDQTTQLDVCPDSQGGFNPALILPTPHSQEKTDTSAKTNCHLNEISGFLPLVHLAWARSGDKGNHANIGVIARRPEYLPYIKAALTTTAVAEFMHHTQVLPEAVSCFELPGLNAINLLLKNSLGGGGFASLRIDAQGKTFAQQLLEFPIPLPQQLIAAIYKQD